MEPRPSPLELSLLAVSVVMLLNHNQINSALEPVHDMLGLVVRQAITFHTQRTRQPTECQLEPRRDQDPASHTSLICSAP